MWKCTSLYILFHKALKLLDTSHLLYAYSLSRGDKSDTLLRDVIQVISNNKYLMTSLIRLPDDSSSTLK